MYIVYYTIHYVYCPGGSLRRDSSPPGPDPPPGAAGSSPASPISIFQSLNIRGLIPQTVPSKVPYVQDELIQSSAVAFAITETWLNKSHLEAETKVDGYELRRCDRKGRKARRGRSSGGTAIYVRDDMDLTTETLLEFSNGVIESICIHVKSLNLVIINTYRSPDQNPKSNDETPSKIIQGQQPSN